MSVSAWIVSITQKLQEAGIVTARLDALVLLEDCLRTDRAQLLAHPEQELTNEQLSLLDTQIARRAGHEPLAFIRGKTEFYGRDFMVDNNVLEPRPESETMIDLLKHLPAAGHKTIIDVGTGSGALAITAKLELADADVIAIDIDPMCLEIAGRNAEKHRVDIVCHEGDLAQPVADLAVSQAGGEVVLLCNLPYVPDDFAINLAATHEPRLAIFGGPDGLDLYRKLFQQLSSFSWRPDYILTEALPPQHQALRDIAVKHGYQLHASDDFIQVFVPAEA